jgi:uncharacterized protein DUF1569
MKTLSDPQTREEIIRRLQAIRSDSTRRWGRMTSHQMICHLADSFRGVIGEKPLTMAPSPLPRGIVRWIALDLPLAWPKDLKTRPEMDQNVGGTPPTEFGADLAALHALFDLFTGSTRPYAGRSHPIFGPMSDADWLRWGYLHMDHHLRQFGV